MSSQQIHTVDKGTVYRPSLKPGITPVTGELCGHGQITSLILDFLISKMNIIVVPTYLTALL